MIIAVDFDGTVVDHRYPLVGPPAPLAIETLYDLIAKKHKLLLFTMRSGQGLADALTWFVAHGITLWGAQYNPELYIDDAAFGCPLIQPEGFNRPCVDWQKVRDVLL